MLQPFPLNWTPRSEPLTPIAVAASGDTARLLVERMLNDNPDRFARMRGLALRDTVVFTGNPDDLPWVPGVEYLGVDPRNRIPSGY